MTRRLKNCEGGRGAYRTGGHGNTAGACHRLEHHCLIGKNRNYIDRRRRQACHGARTLLAHALSGDFGVETRCVYMQRQEKYRQQQRECRNSLDAGFSGRSARTRHWRIFNLLVTPCQFICDRPMASPRGSLIPANGRKLTARGRNSIPREVNLTGQSASNSYGSAGFVRLGVQLARACSPASHMLWIVS